MGSISLSIPDLMYATINAHDPQSHFSLLAIVPYLDLTQVQFNKPAPKSNFK